MEKLITNVGSSLCISDSPPSTTCPFLTAAEMLVFLSAGRFRVGFSSFLLEGEIDRTAPSTKVYVPHLEKL